MSHLSRAAIVVMLLCLVAIANLTSLFDRDEPRFARAAVEMVEGGDYLVPHFAGDLRPDKPILIYWLMSTSIRWLGPTELGARFWSLISMLVVALLIGLKGRELVGREAASWAVVVFCLNPLVLLEGAAAVADPPLLLATTWAFFAVYSIVWGTGGPAAWIGLNLACAVGVLLKGPVALFPLITLLVCVRWVPAGRRRRVIGGLTLCFLVGLGTFFAWLLPADRASQGDLMPAMVGKHFVDRVIGPLEGHGGAGLEYVAWLPFYVVLIPLLLMPWTLYMPSVVAWFRHHRQGNVSGPGAPTGTAPRQETDVDDDPNGGGHSVRSFLLAWIIPPILIMSLVSTKLPHYVFATWPALALALGSGIVHAQREPSTSLRWGLRAYALLSIATGFLLVAGATALSRALTPAHVSLLVLDPELDRALALVRGFTWAIAALIWIGTLVVIGTYGRGPRRALGNRLAAATAVVFLGLAAGLIPALDRLKPVPRLLDRLPCASTCELAAWSFEEPSLVFYVEGSIQFMASEDEAFAWLKQHPEGYLITESTSLARLIRLASGEHLSLDQVAAARGLNIANGKVVNLTASRLSPPPSRPSRFRRSI